MSDPGSGLGVTLVAIVTLAVVAYLVWLLEKRIEEVVHCWRGSVCPPLVALPCPIWENVVQISPPPEPLDEHKSPLLQVEKEDVLEKEEVLEPLPVHESPTKTCLRRLSYETWTSEIPSLDETLNCTSEVSINKQNISILEESLYENKEKIETIMCSMDDTKTQLASVQKELDEFKKEVSAMKEQVEMRIQETLSSMSTQQSEPSDSSHGNGIEVLQSREAAILEELQNLGTILAQLREQANALNVPDLQESSVKTNTPSPRFSLEELCTTPAPFYVTSIRGRTPMVLKRSQKCTQPTHDT